MVKYQFSKNWSWCNDLFCRSEITEKHLDIVYRMDANPCYFGSCKNNCSTNPYCLNSLGEKKLINLLQREPDAPVEKTNYFRKSNEFVGLVNLGATCYINAYLQVWYNNIFFRESILGIQFDKIELEDNYVEENLTNNSESMPELRLKSNDCLATNLQLVFSLMKETIRKSIDPSFFIKALGLDEHIQQDAQEFSQLFLTTLQSTLTSPQIANKLSDASNPFGHKNSDLIHDLFQGEYQYVTECSTCKLQSIRNSNFIELTLNIQNSQTIKDCIDDLLKEEIMDGDNQYFCDNCKTKRNAARKTKLTNLPPILNLQLLRFVYDRNSGYKKKLSSRIKFSEILDLNSYMEQDTDQSNKNVYQLGAILMHVGKTAYSGHYTAQIKNFQSNEWFNFNDEVITKIKKKQQLGCTDDEVDSANKKNDESQKDQEQKQAVKTFSTANAYLLVYYRSDLIEKMPKEEEQLMSDSNQSQIIQVDNELLENWFSNLHTNKMGQNELKNTERTLIHSIYEQLWLNIYDPNKPVSSTSTTNNQKRITNRQKVASKDIIELSDGFETKQKSILKTQDKSLYYFISVDFIRKLICGEFNQSQTDLASSNFTNKYLCAHKLLNPLAINRLKLVSRKGLELMCKVYSVNLADIGALEAYNNQTTRCWTCVTSCFEYLKCKDKLKQDAKLFKQLLKFEFDPMSCEKNGRRSLEANEIIQKHKEEEGNSNVLIEKNSCDENDVILIEKQESGDNEQEDELKSEDCSENNKENRQGKEYWYWVGKETLKQWQNLAIKKYECKLPSFKFADSLTISPEQNGHKPDIIEETNDIQNEIQEIQSVSTASVLDSNPGSSLNYFNEDIICVHNNLSPTQNKRLVCAELWNQIFYQYFYSNQTENGAQSDSNEQNTDITNETKQFIFTNENRECKICLKESEDHAHKKIQVKNQKEILNELYYNRQRPNILDIEPYIEYYLIMTDFIKEWRGLIKHCKYKDIKIFNQTLLCQHSLLPFNELTIDNSMSTLITHEEWEYLSNNYSCDLAIMVIKRPIEKDEKILNAMDEKNSSNVPHECKTEKAENKLEFKYEFYPNVCQECLAQNELDKYLFENKKIVIRQIDDDEPVSTQQLNTLSQTSNGQIPSTNGSSQTDQVERLNSNELKSKKSDTQMDNEDDCEIIHLTSKKARYEIEDDAFEKPTTDSKSQSKTSSIETTNSKQTNTSSSSQPLHVEYLPMRRSKRSRKCKGDLEVIGSSYSTVKSLKLQIASQLSRMISEQHLFFNNIELDNEKTLMDYRINKGDILNLKLDQVNNQMEDIEPSHYELAHVPEIGFKGTNLLK